MSETKRFLTPAEVSARYDGGISVRTLANWRSAGTGPKFTKLGGAVRYPIEEIVKWEQHRTVSSTSEYRS